MDTAGLRTASHFYAAVSTASVDPRAAAPQPPPALATARALTMGCAHVTQTSSVPTATLSALGTARALRMGRAHANQTTSAPTVVPSAPGMAHALRMARAHATQIISGPTATLSVRGVRPAPGSVHALRMARVHAIQPTQAVIVLLVCWAHQDFNAVVRLTVIFEQQLTSATTRAVVYRICPWQAGT